MQDLFKLIERRLFNVDNYKALVPEISFEVNPIKPREAIHARRVQPRTLHNILTLLQVRPAQSNTFFRPG